MSFPINHNHASDVCWYTNSDFYKSMQPNDDENPDVTVTLPKYEIPPPFDPDAFMQCANAWCVADDDLPVTGLNGLMSAQLFTDISDRIDTVYMRPKLAIFIKLVSSKFSSISICEMCSRYGYVKLLTHYIQLGHLPGASVASAAEGGYLECMRIAHVAPDDYTDVCDNAATNGHLNCLQWAHDAGYVWNENTAALAASYNQLHCLRYMYEHGCPMDITATNKAALKGHIDCLKYLHEIGCEWDQITSAAASSGGHLDCLTYAFENGCPWSERTVRLAISCKQVSCLQYATLNGCDIPLDAMCVSAQHNSVDCMRHLHEIGVGWDESVTQSCITSECLKYAIDHGCPPPFWHGRYGPYKIYKTV